MEKNLHVRLTIAFGIASRIESTFRSKPNDMYNEADDIMNTIVKLHKSQNRMKPENYEKRGLELLDRTERIKSAFEVYQAQKKDEEYQQLLAEHAPDADVIEEDEQEPTRGGKREGSGRKPIGTRRVVSISLPDETWQEIDADIEKGAYKNLSQFFRSLVTGVD